jgi:hypothetical protein
VHLDEMPPVGFRLGAPVALELGPDAGKAGQRPVVVDRELDDVFAVSGLGSGAYSAKLLNGTRHWLSGFSHIRQCGDDVFLMFVTGGPLVRGGGGMPQRIIVSSRSVPTLRTTGAG